MSSSSQKISRSQWLIGAMVLSFLLWAGGCWDVLSERAVDLEARSILRDLGRVETEPEPNVPMPEFYTAPPKIVEQMVGGAPEFKLFYFCQHLTSEELRKIIHEQYAEKLFNKKGQSTTIRDYTVSSVPATNQLIVRCPTREDVDSVLETLEWVDVPPVQVKISCLISQIYADLTLDWETTLEIGRLLGEDITAGGSARRFGEGITKLVQEGKTLGDLEILPAFPGASMRELARARMGLKVGYLSLTHDFLALVDILESRGYLKVLMNPTLEVVNGKTAKVLQSEEVPVQRVTQERPEWDYLRTQYDYKPVTDSLQITPHVFANGYIGLETKIEIGSKNTPEGIKQISVLTKKEIDNKENRIRPGESLIIGGIRKTERREVVRGVPMLKDIPVLGILFSGKDYEERAVETIFILTPTISTGGIPRTEMIKKIEKKHARPSRGDTFEAITDPLGLKAGQKEQEQKILEAEQELLKAQAEKAEARGIAREAKAVVERAETEVERARTKAEHLVAEAEKLKADADKAKAEAEAKAKAAEQAKAAADKATADAAKVKTDADAKAKSADKTKTDADKTAADAAKTKSEAEAKAKAAEQTKTAADKAIAEAAKTKAEAEKMAADARKVKEEAEKSKAEADAKTKAAEEALAEARKIKAEAEKAKAEAEAKAKADNEQAAADTEKAEPEADKPKEEPKKAEAKETGEEADEAEAKADEADVPKEPTEEAKAEAEKPTEADKGQANLGGAEVPDNSEVAIGPEADKPGQETKKVAAGTDEVYVPEGGEQARAIVMAAEDKKDLEIAEADSEKNPMYLVVLASLPLSLFLYLSWINRPFFARLNRRFWKAYAEARKA